MYRYTINEKQYIQKPIVLGQIRQLTESLGGLTLDLSQDIMGIINTLGDRLPVVLAAVLIPEGQSIRDKDLVALATDLEAGCDLETAIKVIEDFFTCNPTASLLQKLAGAMKELAPMLTGLKTSPASSQPET